MKLIGREELIEDPRFATGDDRVKHEKELDAIIGEWTRQHDKREAMEKLIAVGVPSGAVFDTMELQNEPTFERAALCRPCNTTMATTRWRPGRCGSTARRCG